MSKSINYNGSGISFFGALTIVFIALKLTDNIDWSWWFVLMPLYIIPAVILGTGAFVFLVGLIMIIIESVYDKLK